MYVKLIGEKFVSAAKLTPLSHNLNASSQDFGVEVFLFFWVFCYMRLNTWICPQFCFHFYNFLVIHEIISSCFTWHYICPFHQGISNKFCGCKIFLLKERTKIDLKVIFSCFHSFPTRNARDFLELCKIKLYSLRIGYRLLLTSQLE